MKKINLFLGLVLCTLIVLSACRKTEGCTDPTAQNYDEFANVEGNCQYLSDGFTGTYVAIDTMYWITNAQEITDTIYYEFTIDRIDNQTMRISNFSNCGQDLTATAINPQEFTVSNQGLCKELRGGYKLEGGILSYSYITFPGDGEQLWDGAGILQ